MRVMIITDSLGLPRSEVSYENVWTDMLLNVFMRKNIVAYTMLKRSLTIKELYDEKGRIGFGSLHPDCIVFQFGIVDASRRAVPSWLEKLTGKVKIICHFIGKHRYQMTKLFNFHDNDPKRFEKYLQNLVEWLEQRPRYYAFVKIAPPGEGLTSKVFNIEADVLQYNEILMNTVKVYGPHGVVLDPYKGENNVEDFILADGHHLNPVGAQLVFDTVYGWIENMALVLAKQG